ncbi:MAG: hypothetical protein RBT76_15595 [candidate division Zixibacteria bacterium]|jgi:hypothetical protein|nr:hypothetical protein [candidate division Zixibacteria bacterium]
MSVYDEIGDLSMGRPHIVILGAGASRATCPDGDKNGSIVPLMKDIISTVELGPLFNHHGIRADDASFESTYSRLHGSGDVHILAEIEAAISTYFQSIELPEYPTIYDLLVVSLRSKDLIATFNWDPLLFQALKRNSKWIDLPNVAFLHGNVAIGFCTADRKCGRAGTLCPKCLSRFENVPLLYPIGQKNYQQNHFIDSEWQKLVSYLKEAYIVTIFGYSAPVSDVEAMQLMTKALAESRVRDLNQIEIIDIQPEDRLRQSWEPFIVGDHYQIFNDFYESFIANHPRRTCEAMWQQLEEIQYLDSRPIPQESGWQALRDWFAPLVEIERARSHRV